VAFDHADSRSWAAQEPPHKRSRGGDDSMNVLVFNTGSASLKFEVIAVSSGNATSDQNRKLVSGVIEGIEEETTLSLLDKKQVVHREKITASD
jgi:acetate kinase